MQRCPHCNEALDDGLLPICWHCGRETRPGAAAPAFDQFRPAPPVQPTPPVEKLQPLPPQPTVEKFHPLPAPPPVEKYHPPPSPQPTVEKYQPLPSPQPPVDKHQPLPPLSSTQKFQPPTGAPPPVAHHDEPDAFDDLPDVPPAAAPPPPPRAAMGLEAWRRWQWPAVGVAAAVAGVVALAAIGRPASDAPVAPQAAVQPPAPAQARPASPAPAQPAPAQAAPVQPGGATPAPAPPAPGAALDIVADEAPSWVAPRRVGYAPDGSRMLTLQLTAMRDLQVWRERVRPVLAVRCMSRRTDVFVALGTSAQPEGGDDHGVTMQFDAEAPIDARWQGSASYQELFAPDGLALARRLTAARLWRFTFTPYNARPVGAEFSVQGLEPHLSGAARACGWPAAETAARRGTAR